MTRDDEGQMPDPAIGASRRGCEAPACSYDAVMTTRFCRAHALERGVIFVDPTGEPRKTPREAAHTARAENEVRALEVSIFSRTLDLLDELPYDARLRVLNALQGYFERQPL